jgi:hypothetical protein
VDNLSFLSLSVEFIHIFKWLAKIAVFPSASATCVDYCQIDCIKAKFCGSFFFDMPCKNSHFCVFETIGFFDIAHFETFRRMIFNKSASAPHIMPSPELRGHHFYTALLGQN